MKRLYFLFITVFTCVALTFVSCGNKDNEPEVKNPVSSSEVVKYPYASLTPEQQKEKLAGEANDFLSEIQDLSKEKAFEVFNAFDKLLRIDEPAVGGEKLGSAGEIIKINHFYGKFTWQPSSRIWKEEKANQLEFNFPVGSSTGKIVVTGVSSGKNYTYEEYYEYYDEKKGRWVEEVEETTFELPKQLSAKMYLGGSEVGGIQVNADIVDAKTAPKSVTVSFALGSFKYTQGFVKSTGKATATLTKGSKVLINAVAVVNGDVDKLILDESNDFSGNFTFQIMDNFAFSGNVDFTKYNKEIDDLYDRCYPYPLPNNFDWEKAEENYTKGAAAIFNKYYDVYLVSIKDKTKIAKLISKAVLTTETYEWYGGTYTESYWEEVPMLRFNDSTEVAVSVYFSEGFDKVVKNFEKFIQSF